MPGSDDLDWLYRRGAHAGRPDDGPPPGDDAWGGPVPSRSPVPPSPPGPPRPPARPVAPAPQPPLPDRPTPRRGRPVLRLTTTLLVLAVVYLVGVPAVAWTLMDRVDAQPNGDRPAQQPGKLFLLTGSDSREGLSAEERRRLGTGTTSGRRTDTMMLLYVPDWGRPALVSLPRDSYVRVPGHGQNKLNAAYALGGPELLTETVELNTGLRVDDYAEIGFGGFVTVIDALDGIRMCPDKAISDRDSHLDIKAGCQTMDGTTALGYVRMRKADPRGDLGRVERQREMVGAVAREAASPASVLNPVRYWRLSMAGAQALSLGVGTGPLDTVRLGVGLLGFSGGEGLTLTVPVARDNLPTSAGLAVEWDASARDLFAEIAAGDTSKLDRFAR